MTNIEKANVREARERAARIRVGMVSYLATLADIAAAYEARDWLTLGYESWQSYIDGEYSETRLRLPAEHRAKAVAELRMAGMSQRAIASAVGVSHETVRRELSGVTDVTPDGITGADGKRYAATRPDSPTARPLEGEAGRSGPDRPFSDAAEGPMPGPATGWVGPVSEAPAATGPAAGAGDLGVSEAIRRYVESDPDVQTAEYMKRFWAALERANAVTQFDVDRLANIADPLAIEMLQRHVETIKNYADRVTRARSGLRLVRGGMA